MSLISDVRDGLGRLDISPKSLKKFAYTIAVVLFVLAILVLFIGHHLNRSFWLVGFTILFFMARENPKKVTDLRFEIVFFNHKFI